MITYISIIITAIFVNNIVFAQFLGICPFLGVSKKLSSAAGMGAAVTLATPSTAQLVVISGKNTPSALYSAGAIFLSIISSICTSAAMMRLHRSADTARQHTRTARHRHCVWRTHISRNIRVARIRTRTGTDIAAFEHTSTPEVARPMESPVMAEPVVPSVGHMPSNRYALCTASMQLAISPVTKCCHMPKHRVSALK